MKYRVLAVREACELSRPARGAWVEIYFSLRKAGKENLSRPARGAWVEIKQEVGLGSENRSRPARGAWVEIDFR